MSSLSQFHSGHHAQRNGSGGSGGQTGPKFHAVIIGEPIVAGVVDPLGYPLSPLSPSAQVPYALLPICNTPLIDYILENLVENGVNEVTLLVSARSMPAVHAHLSESRTARGKPWMMSDAITVNVLEAFRDITKLADAVSEIRDRNVVPQSGSFLFVPIESISFFHNLRECLHRHLERVRTVGKYAATLLCTPARARLDATLHGVLDRQLAERDEAASRRGAGAGTGIGSSASSAVAGGLGSGGTGGGSARQGSGPAGASDGPGSPISERDGLLEASGGGGGDGLLAEYANERHYVVPSQPAEHHTMFVLDQSTNVVLHMSRQEAGDEPPEPPLITFSKKRRVSVRMDLAPTGFLLCCCEALALVEFHIRDTWDFLSTSLLGQVEIYGNVFGILEVPRPDAFVVPVCSLSSYIQANLDVCARRLFPLTRESCFAEALAKYAAVSSGGWETVYTHTSAKIHASAQQSIGPNVVIGENVMVPASAKLVGTICGANVQLGEGVSLVSCVVLDGAVIGAGCSIRESVIGVNAVIASGTDLRSCIIGAGCVLSAASTQTGAAGGLSLHNQAIVYEPDSADKDGNGSGSSGSGSSSSSSGSGSSSSSSSSSDDDDDGDDVERAAPVKGRGKGKAKGAGGGDTDQWLVGADGLGRGLVERYSSAIVPTQTLFTEDPLPGKAGDGSDSGDGSGDTSDSGSDDDEALFNLRIRKHVEAALLNPSRIEASSYDMSTLCLSHGLGYPVLCEVVTEMLVEHILQKHSSEGGDACLAAADNLFGMWCSRFYNGFLSKNGKMHLEAMVSTLEGMALAISSPACVLYHRAPELLELLYNLCDEQFYQDRGYCIVSAQGMIAFDTEMTRRRRNLEMYAGFGKKRQQQQQQPSSSSSSSDDDDDDDGESEVSRDRQEEGKVTVAGNLHAYIISVKEYLEANGEL